MKILFYALNYSPELIGCGKYTGEMVEWLANHGHECRVLTTPPYYPDWRVAKGYSTWKYKKEFHKNNNVEVYRCPLWVPKRPHNFSRIIHLLSFNISSFPLLLKQFFWKPDVIVCIAPSFLIAPQGLLLKLVGVKTWLHFQDFEICAMFGTEPLGIKKKLSKIAHMLQAVVIRQFHVVSSISTSMCKRLERSKINKKSIALFPNWVDTNFITPYASKQFFREKWNIDSRKKIILYSGNLGRKQGLEILLEVADVLQDKKNILFVIVGNGVYKRTMQATVLKRKIKNIEFYPLQSYKDLPALLRMADIHLVIQKYSIADAVLPSKVSHIFAAGGYAIITADPDTELGYILVQYPEIATIVKPENPYALVSAINSLCDRSKVDNINEVARQYTIKHLDKDAVLSLFEKRLLGLLH